jgi:hypothetical protein
MADPADQEHRGTGRRSRRQLMAGAAGVLGGLAAGTLLEGGPAQAAQGSPVLEGQDNTGATVRTAVFTTGNNEFAILADPNSSGRGSLGVYGFAQDTGVLGEAASGSSFGIGVVGNGAGNGPGVSGSAAGVGDGVTGFSSGTGAGVFGTSTSGAGVDGHGATGVQGFGTGIGVLAFGTGNNGVGVNATGTGSGAGVIGNSGSTGPGVVGISFTQGVVATGGATGVVATGGTTGVVATGGGDGAGVQGKGAGVGSGVTGFGGSNDGAGVSGRGGGSNGAGLDGVGVGTGPGVLGIGSGSGHGVRGTASASGAAGVFAENTAGGTALQVTGPAVFSRSGVVRVPSGKSTATVTGVSLTPASLVLATLQQFVSGVSVLAAVPNVAGRSFTVHLSKSVTASAKVAWFIVS